MKIWVIGRNYPLPGNNMQGSFELEQAQMLARHGNEVLYLACSLHPTKRIKKKGMLSWSEDGLEVNVFSTFFPPRIFPFYFNKQRNRLWKKLLNDVAARHGLPDVIHVHYPAMLMIADALADYHRNGVRIVATEHWSKVLDKKLDGIERREYRKFSCILDQMICVGSPLAKVVSELTGKEVAVVPNVVSEVFKPSTEKHDGFRFVAVGRLIKLKQFDKVIKAFAECFRGKKDVTLTIVGEGEEKAKLQQITHAENVSSQVYLPGSLDRQRTAEIVSNSDNLICYSTLETFGVPIIEAWACGLSTIVTTTAGVIQDTFHEKFGVAVPPGDFGKLKHALLFVYDHRTDYDKDFIADFALRHFSEMEVCNRLIEMYCSPGMKHNW